MRGRGTLEKRPVKQRCIAVVLVAVIRSRDGMRATGTLAKLNQKESIGSRRSKEQYLTTDNLKVFDDKGEY